jgi:flagellar assembly factor FliW
MFGSIDVADEDVIRVPGGLIGFEEHQRFVLVQAEELKPLVWLVSIEEPELAFPLADPGYFTEKYHVTVEREDREILDIDTECDEAVIYVIVTLPDGQRPLTANLRGPIVMNRTTRVARQLILVSETYSHRQRALADAASFTVEE